jgi:hypothetical protein
MSTPTLDLFTAQAWISAWRANPVQDVKAFFIPVDDMLAFFDDPLYTGIGVRAYLAFGNFPGKTPEPKLVMVDVNSDGTDNLNAIYDFTSPCPQTCDTASPLYTLINDGSNPPAGGNKILLSDAITWITDWRNIVKQGPYPDVKAFFIPKDDIIDLLSDANCIGARAYLAWGTTDTNPSEAKLVLVDVQGDISIPDGSKDMIMEGLYDFTSPCPQTCDFSSQLYTLLAKDQY